MQKSAANGGQCSDLPPQKKLTKRQKWQQKWQRRRLKRRENEGLEKGKGKEEKGTVSGGHAVAAQQERVDRKRKRKDFQVPSRSDTKSTRLESKRPINMVDSERGRKTRCVEDSMKIKKPSITGTDKKKRARMGTKRTFSNKEEVNFARMVEHYKSKLSRQISL